MNPDKKTARLAGFLYLIVVITGIFSLGYVPSKLITGKDPVATVSNIISHPWLYRWGIISGTVCYITFLLLPLVLYRLLNSVNETAARLMVVLAIVSIPISFLNLQHKFEALTLIERAGAFATTTEIAEQVMLQLKAYNSGILIVQIFWGLWLLPLGWLVYRSGFLPKVLGVFLIAGCFGYVIDFIGTVGIPGYNETVIGNFITKPATLGEIGICLWLLIIGIQKKRSAPTNSLA